MRWRPDGHVQTICVCLLQVITIITIYLHYLSIIAGNRYLRGEARVWLGVNEMKKSQFMKYIIILPYIIIIILPTIKRNNTEYVLQTKNRTTVYDVWYYAHTYVIQYRLQQGTFRKPNSRLWTISFILTPHNARKIF